MCDINLSILRLGICNAKQQVQQFYFISVTDDVEFKKIAQKPLFPVSEVQRGFCWFEAVGSEKTNVGFIPNFFITMYCRKKKTGFLKFINQYLKTLMALSFKTELL